MYSDQMEKLRKIVDITSKIAVCSRSFSKNPQLRSLLLNEFSNVKFNETGSQFTGDELIQFIKECDKVIIGLEKINSEILSQLPDLKVISKYGVGLDNIDIQALKKYEIKLGWVGGVNKRSVAELVLGLIFCLTRHIVISNNEIKKGGWSQNVGSELTGKTIGIIGCGNIGKDLAILLRPFSCKILAYDIKKYETFYLENNIQGVNLEKLLRESDVITLHVPLNSSTKNILSEESLSIIKDNAILINTARGGLVDEVSLKKCLLEKPFMRAAFDVFNIEPPIDNDLLNLPNFICTPHIGGSTNESILAMGKAAIEGLKIS